jgi:hypothetical protein
LAWPFITWLHVLTWAVANLDLYPSLEGFLVSWVPDLEVDKFKSLEAVDGIVLEDEALAGLDDKIREKLIA